MTNRATLAQLLAGMDKAKRHPEVSFGHAVGREFPNGDREQVPGGCDDGWGGNSLAAKPVGF